MNQMSLYTPNLLFTCWILLLSDSKEFAKSYIASDSMAPGRTEELERLSQQASQVEDRLTAMRRPSSTCIKSFIYIYIIFIFIYVISFSSSCPNNRCEAF